MKEMSDGAEILICCSAHQGQPNTVFTTRLDYVLMEKSACGILRSGRWFGRYLCIWRYPHSRWKLGLSWQLGLSIWQLGLCLPPVAPGQQRPQCALKKPQTYGHRKAVQLNKSFRENTSYKPPHPREPPPSSKVTRP